MCVHTYICVLCTVQVATTGGTGHSPLSLSPPGWLFLGASGTEGRWLLLVTVVRRTAQTLEVRVSSTPSTVHVLHSYVDIPIEESLFIFLR